MERALAPELVLVLALARVRTQALAPERQLPQAFLCPRLVWQTQLVEQLVLLIECSRFQLGTEGHTGLQLRLDPAQRLSK